MWRWQTRLSPSSSGKNTSRKRPLDRYTDLSGITKIRTSVERIIEIAKGVVALSREPVKSALLADNPANLEDGTNLRAVMEDATMIEVRTFSDRQNSRASGSRCRQRFWNGPRGVAET